MAKRVTSSPLDINVSGIKMDIDGLKVLKKLMMNLPAVDVGYLNGEKHPKWDLTFAELAVINNFGVRGDSINVPGWKIPPRPFFHNTFISHRGFENEIQAALTKAITSKSQVAATQAFKAIGKRAADRLNLMVHAGGHDFAPNAAFTITRKGKDDPLNWTGALAKAGKFRLVKKTTIKP